MPPAPANSDGDDVFLITAAALATDSAALAVVAFAQPDWIGGRPWPQVSILLSVALLPVAGWFFVWPAMARRQAEALIDLPTALKDAQARVSDLEVVRREHQKARVFLEEADKVLREKKDELAALLKAAEQVILDRKKLDEENAQLRQEAGRQGREAERWREALVGYFSSLELALAPDNDLSPEYKAAVGQLVKRLARAVAPLGLELVSPQPGDPFDDRLHQVEGQEPSESVTPGAVLCCAAWGYRNGGTLIRRARVVLSSRPATKTAAEPNPSPTTPRKAAP